MDPKNRQRLLIAVIAFCLVFIAYWWYQSPYGPGGRYKYGLIQVSWTNGASGAGTLVLALDRSPAKTVCAGKVSSFTSGLTVHASDSLTSADAETVQSLLPSITGQAISAIDTGANTITFAGITPPKGWPPAPSSGKNPTWVAGTTNKKGGPSSSINVIPSENGCGS